MIVNKNKLVEEIINNISFLEEPREGIKINNDNLKRIKNIMFVCALTENITVKIITRLGLKPKA